MALPNPFNTAAYEYPWPLDGYEDAPPLSEEKNEDGVGFKNPAREGLSDAYEKLPDILDKGKRGAFDVHIYYFQQNEEQTKYARALRERVRREFPELVVNKFWDGPIGPHPIASFSVNLYTPAQFGAFVPWITFWRGPLSVLLHPNTVEPGVDLAASELRDHTERATWMGERIPLDLALFHRQIKANAAKKKLGAV